MLPQLRNFILRDDRQIQEYLEAIERGAIEGPIIQTEGSKGSVGGGLALGTAHLGGRVEAKKGTEESSQAQVVRTPAANFQRLYDFLQEAEGIEMLEACDDACLEAVALGQVVEAQVVGRLSRQDQQILRIQQGASQLTDLVKVANDLKGVLEPFEEAASAFGVDLDTDDPEFANTIDKIKNFKAPVFPEVESPRKIAIVGTLIGYSRPVFAVPVRTETLQKEPGELDGEYTILGKVIKKIPTGATCDATEYSSLPSSLNRARRRKTETSSTEPIKGPAMVLEPIAMYR